MLDSIVEYMRTHDDPAVTVSEVAAGVDGIDYEQAKYRLEKLAKQDRVHKKKVGSAAAIWYPKG